MREVQYTQSQQERIDELRAYLEQQGVDPNQYMSKLDGQLVNQALLDDPLVQAYFKMEVLQLMEILYPTQLQSIYSEVGEINYEEVQARVDEDVLDFIKNLIADSPELMAFAATRDGNAATQAGEIINQIAQLEAGAAARSPAAGDPAPGGEDGAEAQEDDLPRYVDTEAREMGERFGLDGLYYDMVEREENMQTLQYYWLAELAEKDSAIAQITADLRAGRISQSVADAMLKQESGERETLMFKINNAAMSLQTMLEQFSKLVKSQYESLQIVANNLRS